MICFSDLDTLVLPKESCFTIYRHNNISSIPKWKILYFSVFRFVRCITVITLSSMPNFNSLAITVSLTTFGQIILAKKGLISNPKTWKEALNYPAVWHHKFDLFNNTSLYQQFLVINTWALQPSNYNYFLLDVITPFWQ